ncbi:MAG: GGDEF domain-containing protein [Comamonas sp.]
MTAGHYYALSLPLCTTLLALGCLACWRWRPAQRDALWMAGCFALCSLGFAGQIAAIPAAFDDSAVLSALCYHGAAWCLAEAMAQRFGVAVARLPQALVGGAALAALTYYAYGDYQLYTRVYILNFGLGAQLALGTWRLWRLRPVQRLERALWALFALLVLSFFVRTVLTLPERLGVTEARLSGSTFWIVLQLSLLVFALVFAMLYVALTVRDALVQLQEERNRDPLTQLLNRRAFMEALEHGPRAHPQQPLGTVLVCDVDHFKQVNDRWGHAAGDAVLQGFAQVLQGSVREGDLVARFGGEEFVLLLYSMPVDAAVQLAQRIRTRLAALRFAALPAGQRVTASLGVAQVPSLAQLHAAIAQADRWLYAAKADGRDCVRWEPAPVHSEATVLELSK